MNYEELRALRAHSRFIAERFSLLRVARMCRVAPPADHAFVTAFRQAAAFVATELAASLAGLERSWVSRLKGMAPLEAQALAAERTRLDNAAEAFRQAVVAMGEAPAQPAWTHATAEAERLERELMRMLACEEVAYRNLMLTTSTMPEPEAASAASQARSRDTR